MELALVTKHFNDTAPLNLAESWDNVGLLVEPTTEKLVSKILFTNDLTTKVLKEALNLPADIIYSYHPPIFSSFKRLQKSEWKHNIILTCIENQIAVYSPHTALDAKDDGVNDWLISCFDLESSRVIHQSNDVSDEYTHQVEFAIDESVNKQVIESIEGTFLLNRLQCRPSEVFVKVLTTEKALCPLLSYISNKSTSPVSVTKCEKKPLLKNGMGRIGKLVQSITLHEAIALVKGHVKAKHIRVSFANDHNPETLISSVAVCAGSGSSVLRKASAELYVTGEMSHHDLLDAAHRGVTVILCEHSNSERGFLKDLVKKLKSKLAGVELVVSESDVDPITIL